MLDRVAHDMRFVLESSRRVAVHLSRTLRSGDEDERSLVVFCHSSPGAGGFDPDPALTRARDVTLLSVDRPGYGSSSRVSVGNWATVGAAADDIATVLDALPVERVGVVGWSAGGRVALALAARHPDLVDRVVVVATPAPDEDVPWVEPDQRTELERLRQLPPEEAHAALCRSLAPVVPSDPFSDHALWLLASEGTSDKAALLSPRVRNRLGEMLRASFAQGAAGLAADIAGYCLQPWGFEPEAVQAKTLLLYGTRDPLAGPRHARWWQERLPNVRLETDPDAGHLVLISKWSRALAYLTPDRERIGAAAGLSSQGEDSDFEEFPAA
jgi:pimeloyl-ACP methyl ester carboxylesterase